MVTQGLLEILDDEELRAVLAHELGHVKEHHIFFYLLFLLGYLVVATPLSLLAEPLWLAYLPSSIFGTFSETDLQTLLSLLLALPPLLLLLLYFRFLFGFFIRNYERQADLHGLELMGTPYPLISALEKVALHSGNIRDVPSWHHFSIKERVDFLTAAGKNPALMRNHRLKVRRALMGYLGAILTTGLVSYLFYSGVIGKDFSARLNEQLEVKRLLILEYQVKLEPENPSLLSSLGTLYYSRNEPKEAVFHLERALELDPDNPEIMNNLAWILATSKEKPYFQPQRALALAKKAAADSRESYILDTLAEAYYANGQTRKALAVAERALAAASENRSYYLQQVDRFRAEFQQQELK